MEIELENRRENKILGREEITFKITYEGKTPSRAKIKEQLKNLLEGKGIIIIEHIKTVYGVPEAKGYARVYTSEKKAKEIEEEHIIERNFREKKKEKEEKGEEVKEEKKEKEEKGEEVKEEKEEGKAKGKEDEVPPEEIVKGEKEEEIKEKEEKHE